MAEPATKRMTAEEFFAWQERQEELYELVDGQPVPRLMTGASRRHDQVVVNAIAAFRSKLRGGPCRASTDDVAVRGVAGNLRRPDLTIDCGPFEPDSYQAAEPVLVLEVLSPSTEAVDKLVKLEEYKALPSMRHILYAEARTPHVMAYGREPDGSWRAMDHIGLDSVLDLPAIGCSLSLAELYEDVAPAQPRT